MQIYYTVEQSGTSTDVVTLEQAKKQLKMEDLGTFDDELINDCIEAAIDEAENYCNIAIIQKTVKATMANWLNNLELKHQKILQITSIKYKDQTGAEQTLPVSFYKTVQLDAYAVQLQFNNVNALPKVQSNNTTAIEIVYTVGYSKGETPKAIQQAIKLLLTDNYEYRGDRERPINLASRVKLEPYKYYTTPNG